MHLTSGGALPVPSPASKWGEPFVPAASALPGLLLLLPVQTSDASANSYQVLDRLWTGVHRQLSVKESRGRHEKSKTDSPESDFY